MPTPDIEMDQTRFAAVFLSAGRAERADHPGAVRTDRVALVGPNARFTGVLSRTMLT